MLDFACRHIGERAAVPNQAQIIERMPLTALGKIFKPALQYDAIRRVSEQELLPLVDLIEAVKFQLREDKIHRTKAVIGCRPRAGSDPEMLKKRISEQLQRYTVRYELVFD